MNRRHVAFGIGFAALLVLVTFVLVEVALRVYAGAASTDLAEGLRRDPLAVLVEPHGEAGFRPRPDRTIEYEDMGRVAHTNSMGFRGPLVSIPKPPGVVRVVLLGGSTAFGWGLDDDQTIDRHMRTLLAERHPERTIEVVNLAFDGYDSWQVFERFRSDALSYEPDFVIVHSGINDVRNAWFRDIRDGDRRTLLYLATLDQMRYEKARGGPTLWTRTKHWLVVARLPGWIAQQRQFAERREAAAGLPPRPTHRDALDYFERNLQHLLDLKRARLPGAAVLFSTPPSSLLTFDDPPPASYWLQDKESTQIYRDSLSARMRSLADRERERVGDVVFVPHEALGPEYFLDGAHLNDAGNRVIARNFVNALEPWLSAGRDGDEAP